MPQERSLLRCRWQQLYTRLGAALRREGRALWAGLRDPLLWGLALATVLLATLACQVVQPFGLDIGQRPEEAYLTGFYEPEESAAGWYRWTRAASSVEIPGLGQAPCRLDLTLAAPRPNSVAAPNLRLLAGGRPLLETTVGSGPQVYSILLPAADLPAGNLQLVLQSEVFTPAGNLAPGYYVDDIAIQPLSGGSAYAQDLEASDGHFTITGTSSWAWGVPNSGPQGAHSGTHAWVTNLDGNYGWGENGYLVSPAIDLSAYAGQSFSLSWWQWLQTDPRCGFASVEASNDGGGSWHRIYGEVSGNIDLAWARHEVLLDPSYATSSFRVRFHLRTCSGDTRPLGVMLERLEVVPAGSPIVPPWETLLWSSLTVLLAVILARRLGWSRWIALGAGVVLALLLAALLAWGRPLLAPALPFLPLGLACAWLLVALFQGGVRSLFARGGAALGPAAERFLWTALVLFFVVRLAGVLHPAHETWDLCFHYHRLESVTRGQVLFTIESGEWRGLTTLYLPTPYLLLAPFWALFGGRLVPFEVMNVLLDTSAALLVAYIARRLLGRGAAAPLAALLYLTMPQSYIIFSWGIVANILGQWLFLLLLAIVVSPAGRLERWSQWLPAAGVLLLAVLAHPGTVLLTAGLLGALVVTAGLDPPRAWPRPAAGRWALAGLAAVVLSLGLYYSHFVPTMLDSLRQMGQGANVEQPAHGGILVRGPVLDAGLGLVAVEVGSRTEALFAGVRELAAEARAYYHTAPLVLALAALPGLVLERRALAARLLGLSWVVALLFAVVGLALNLYVRYMYFLLPFVALGAAWWLARVGRRGWAGRAVGLLAGAFLLWTGLAFWVQHVLYYSAGCR